MSDFDTLYKQIICENTGYLNVGIFPGAFKPPHKGHFSTALNACMQNDIIWLFVSDKSRIVEQPKHDMNSNSGSCDSDRYANFFNDKGAAVRERLGGLKRGDCERETSATTVRNALYLGDTVTVRENLPQSIGDGDLTKVESILSTTRGGGEITGDMATNIWNIYRPHLLRLCKARGHNVEINIEKIKGSPVAVTYDTVSSYSEKETAQNTNITLYVGV